MSDPTPMSAEEVRQMEEEAKIIAIAITQGWTECRSVIKGPGGGTRYPTAHGKPPGRAYEAPCPRCTRDLNAMASAVDYLRNADRMAYGRYAYEVRQGVAKFNSRPDRQSYHPIMDCDAPAEIRADAFLIAVKGASHE